MSQNSGHLSTRRTVVSNLSLREKIGQPLTDTQFAILLVLPALALFFFIILYPLLNSMYIGLLDKSLVMPGESFVGLKNLQRVFQKELWLLFKNTMIFTVGATLLPFVIGFGVALILNGAVKGRAFWRGAFLLPWLVPGVIVSFLWLWIFNANYGVLNGLLRTTGLIDSNINWLGLPGMAMLAVIIAKSWQTFPWIMVMILAGLQTIPRDLVEAAAIDGANRWRIFLHVTVPQLRGISSVVLLLSFIWNFQHFENIYVMTEGGPAKATTTFSIAVYQTAFQAFDLGRAGAIGIWWMALLSVLVVVYLKFSMNEEA
jgi:multiple sugar transport system permease protein